MATYYETKFGIQRLTPDEESLLADAKRKYKVECPKCGHRVSFYHFELVTKKICCYCGIYVFKDKKEEFNYRVREAIRFENTIKWSW